MTPEKKETQVQLFEDPILKQRMQMLSSEIVTKKMTFSEMMLADASTKLPVKAVENAGQQLIVIGKGILRDIGIRDWSDENANKYRLIRFADVVLKYFPNFSLKEVKLAFEFMAVGHLDEFLPKDRHGKPEKNHYQDFSMEYYSKILTAYKEYRAQVWHKAKSNFPLIPETISDQEKKEGSNILIEDIYEAFDNFKEKKIAPNFDLHVHFKVLVEAGFIEPEKVELSSIKQAYRSALLDKLIQGIERRKMIDTYAEGKMTQALTVIAWNVQNNKTIKRYFEKLIEEKKDIRDYLKKIE